MVLMVLMVLMVPVVLPVFVVLLHWLRFGLTHFTGRCSTGRFGSRNVSSGYDGCKRDGNECGDDDRQDLFHGELLGKILIPVFPTAKLMPEFTVAQHAVIT